MMREIQASEISDAVRRLCVEANCHLPQDVYQTLSDAYEQEDSATARTILGILKENADIAAHNEDPICQDTGMACIFCEVGQDVHINGSLSDAIQEGVRRGYQEGYLRKSIVSDPAIDRVNTQDNTPALIHYDIVTGDQVRIKVAPKGFGSENMCQIKMLKPSDGIEGVKNFILQVVSDAGPNPCPPLVIGVGVGANFEGVALLAKKAMMREIGTHNEDPRYAAIEEEMLAKVNALGIGPAGFGGGTTALALAVEWAPTHIAGLPCAVAICCHVARHKEVVL